jgi:hypothetical protein
MNNCCCGEFEIHPDSIQTPFLFKPICGNISEFSLTCKKDYEDTTVMTTAQQGVGYDHNRNRRGPRTRATAKVELMPSAV